MVTQFSAKAFSVIKFLALQEVAPIRGLLWTATERANCSNTPTVSKFHVPLGSALKVHESGSAPPKVNGRATLQFVDVSPKHSIYQQVLLCLSYRVFPSLRSSSWKRARKFINLSICCHVLMQRRVPPSWPSSKDLFSRRRVGRSRTSVRGNPVSVVAPPLQWLHRGRRHQLRKHGRFSVPGIHESCGCSLCKVWRGWSMVTRYAEVFR